LEDARGGRIIVFGFGKAKASEAERVERPGDWYADPFGKAARRWYDDAHGWSDRVQGEGEEPDQTGSARIDDAATSTPAPTEQVDEESTPAAEAPVRS
jgi:hypothetical protein